MAYAGCRWVSSKQISNQSKAMTQIGGHEMRLHYLSPNHSQPLPSYHNLSQSYPTYASLSQPSFNLTQPDPISLNLTQPNVSLFQTSLILSQSLPTCSNLFQPVLISPTSPSLFQPLPTSSHLSQSPYCSN
jgi:hypothetical protein